MCVVLCVGVSAMVFAGEADKILMCVCVCVCACVFMCEVSVCKCETRDVCEVCVCETCA